MVKIVNLIKNLPKPNKNRRVMIAYFIFFSLFAIPVILYQMKPNDPAVIAAQEQKDLVSKVSELIDLPTNEEPITATISDKTQLGNQEFFANALNGDKVLIYERSKQVILYRPSTKKIIAVAPLADPSPIPVQEVAGASASAQLSPEVISIVPTSSPQSFITPTQAINPAQPSSTPGQ